MKQTICLHVDRTFKRPKWRITRAIRDARQHLYEYVTQVEQRDASKV